MTNKTSSEEPTMKRYNRMNHSNLCMMPRKVIAWIIMSMACMAMVSLMVIEVRRIMAVRGLIKPNNLHRTSNFHFQDENNRTNNHYHEVHFRGLNQELDRDVTHFLLGENLSNVNDNNNNYNNNSNDSDDSSDIIEALFEDHPHCRTRPYLLILVTSGPENFERRDAIRKGWANPEGWRLRVSGLKSKTLFLTGRSTTKFLNILLKNENDITGDILLGDYLDTYRNLTTKVVHGFTWAARHCRPSYVLKTDDDCFVNVPLLLQFLSKYNPVPDNLYVGKIRWSAPVIRDPNSRWYVSKTEYPKQRYAPYAIGAGYIFSYDVLEKMVYFSDKMHIFPNEDAFVGAVLNAAGVRPTYSERFVSHPGPWQMCNFLYLFVVHKVKPSRQNEYKDMANAAVERCSLEHMVTDWV